MLVLPFSLTASSSCGAYTARRHREHGRWEPRGHGGSSRGWLATRLSQPADPGRGTSHGCQRSGSGANTALALGYYSRPGTSHPCPAPRHPPHPLQVRGTWRGLTRQQHHLESDAQAHRLTLFLFDLTNRKLIMFCFIIYSDRHVLHYLIYRIWYWWRFLRCSWKRPQHFNKFDEQKSGPAFCHLLRHMFCLI